MAPLPLNLAGFHQLIRLLGPSYVLAKRDWRHGFHHLTLHPTSRKLLGIRLPSGHIARAKAAAFGPS